MYLCYPLRSQTFRRRAHADPSSWPFAGRPAPAHGLGPLPEASRLSGAGAGQQSFLLVTGAALLPSETH